MVVAVLEFKYCIRALKEPWAVFDRVEIGRIGWSVVGKGKKTSASMSLVRRVMSDRCAPPPSGLLGSPAEGGEWLVVVLLECVPDQLNNVANRIIDIWHMYATFSNWCGSVEDSIPLSLS